MNQALENEKARAREEFERIGIAVGEGKFLDSIITSSFTAGEKAGREAAVEYIVKNCPSIEGVTSNEQFLNLTIKQIEGALYFKILPDTVLEAALKADTSDRV